MVAIPPITEVSIDFSTLCQLKCVECSTSKGITHNGIIGKGVFTLSDFVRFIQNNPQIKRIETSNWGEIFLNQDMADIIKYAYENGITLYCGNGSNFNNVSERVIEYLVKYKFEYLNLSIDGATQETYVKYRVNGNLSNVLKNIEKLNFYKRKYNSDFPKLSWQFIIFGHNEHELPIVKQLCKKYGMTFNPKLNYSSFSPVRDKEFVKRESELGVSTREEYKALHKKEYKIPCYHCFVSPQINWNGDILGCSVNKWGTMGNIKQTSIEEWQNSDVFKKLVALLFEQTESSKCFPCNQCPNLATIKDHPLTQSGLEEYMSYIPPALRNDTK